MASTTLRLISIPIRTIHIELASRAKILVISAPRHSCRSYFLSRVAKFRGLRVAASMRESDVLQIPKQSRVNIEPSLLMLNAKFFDPLDLFTTAKTNVSMCFLYEAEQNLSR